MFRPSILLVQNWRNKTMRYYSTQRPVGPGTFPKLPENKVLEVHNFEAKMFLRGNRPGGMGVY